MSDLLPDCKKRACIACKASKVKCDKELPICGRCLRLKLECIQQIRKSQQASKNLGGGSTASSKRKESNPSYIPRIEVRKQEPVISPASALLAEATYEEMVNFLANTARELNRTGMLKRDRVIELLRFCKAYGLHYGRDFTRGLGKELAIICKIFSKELEPPMEAVAPENQSKSDGESSTRTDGRAGWWVAPDSIALPSQIVSLDDGVSALAFVGVTLQGYITTLETNELFADLFFGSKTFEKYVLVEGALPIFAFCRLIAPEDREQFLMEACKLCLTEQVKETYGISMCLEKSGKRFLSVVRMRGFLHEDKSYACFLFSVMPLPQNKYTDPLFTLPEDKGGPGVSLSMHPGVQVPSSLQEGMTYGTRHPTFMNPFSPVVYLGNNNRETSNSEPTPSINQLDPPCIFGGLNLPLPHSHSEISGRGPLPFPAIKQQKRAPECLERNDEGVPNPQVRRMQSSGQGRDQNDLFPQYAPPPPSDQSHEPWNAWQPSSAGQARDTMRRPVPLFMSKNQLIQGHGWAEGTEGFGKLDVPLSPSSQNIFSSTIPGPIGGAYWPPPSLPRGQDRLHNLFRPAQPEPAIGPGGVTPLRDIPFPWSNNPLAENQEENSASFMPGMESSQPDLWGTSWSGSGILTLRDAPYVDPFGFDEPFQEADRDSGKSQQSKQNDKI